MQIDHTTERSTKNPRAEINQATINANKELSNLLSIGLDGFARKNEKPAAPHPAENASKSQIATNTCESCFISL